MNNIKNEIIVDEEFAILTNEIYKEWSDMTLKEYKEYKGLRKESLRDNMDSIELILTDLNRSNKKVGIKAKTNWFKKTSK